MSGGGGGDLSGIERGSLGSRGSLPSCSTTTRVHGGAMGSAGAPWPAATVSAPLSQLWFGRQVHATRVFVWSQLLLAALAAVLLLAAATGSGLEPTRFDWLLGPSNDGVVDYDDNTATPEPAVVNYSSTTTQPPPSESTAAPRSKRATAVGAAPILAGNYYERKRSVGSLAVGLAYFYIISIGLAWWGVQAAEARGRRAETDGDCRATASARDESCLRRFLSRCGGAACMRRATATLLLTPWLLSVLSLLVPLLVLTSRLLSDPCYYVYDTTASHTLYEIWYKYLPLITLWCLTLYALSGCALAFVFTWRRADGRFGGGTYGTYGGFRRGTTAPRNVPLRESAGAASFSWTFRSTKDRYRITNKDGDLNKSTYSMASNRSYKSTRNPTLRGYTRKTDDMDVSLISEDNYAAGDSLERNYNNNRRMTPSEQMRASRGFTAYSGPGVTRAHLEPVEEEEGTPTPEKTAENGDLRM